MATIFLTCCSSEADTITIAGREYVVPTGFTLEQAVSPDLAPRPIVADFNEVGDLFVADSSGSNDDVQTQLKERPHRILRLRDTDGDGQFDQRTVFADKMMFPEGVMAYRGSVYVSAPPQIWQLTDTSGDGVADQRVVWFDGKTLTGCANDLHGPYLGRDGWIYWCKGAFAEQTYERRDGSSWSTRAAHIFRRRLEGGLIEPVMNGGMDNPVDVVMTSAGEKIFTTTFFQHPANGQRDGLVHAVYGGLYGKIHGVLDGHVRTGELLPPLSHLGPAAPCGLAVIESDRWGEDFTGNLISCAFNLHQVIRHRVESRGAGLVTIDEPLISTEDLDFHPTDVLEDADGSLLIVDTGGWYKLCCPSSQLHKPDVLGGIYRLRPVTTQPREDATDERGNKLAWNQLSPPELVALLTDDRPVVRQRATDQLRQRGEAAIPALLTHLQSHSTKSRDRLSIVWAVAPIDTPAVWPVLEIAIRDQDARVRQAAWHVVSVRRQGEAVALLSVGLQDESSAVRRVAAEAAGRLGDVAAVPLLMAACEQASEDRFLEHSLIYALIELRDVQALRAALSSPVFQQVRVSLVALDQLPAAKLQSSDVLPYLVHHEEALRVTAKWIATRRPEWTAAVAATLESALPALQADRAETQQLAELLAENVGADAVQAALARMLQRDDWLESSRLLRKLLRTGRPQHISTPLADVIELRLAAADDDERSAWLEVLGELNARLHGDSLVSLLASWMQTEELSLAERRLAMLSLGNQSPPLPDKLFAALLRDLVDAEDHQRRRVAASTLAVAPLTDVQREGLLQSLPTVGMVELPGVLRALSRHTNADLGGRVWSALQSNPAWVLLPSETVREAFSSYGDAIKNEVADTLEHRVLANADQAARLNELYDSLPTGDVRRGQIVFHSAKVACFSCHAMGYRGGDIGPDLTRIGQVRSRRDLLESIVFPSASFVRSYEPVTIEMASGVVLQGVIKDETSQRVKLVNSQREVLDVLRADIEAIQPSSVSVMPSGMDQLLNAQELSDLIEFLRSAK
ncbi:MAG: HEAT repeat domain-containing protein [Planctomycetales bacterium]|nr:HEAT repeat domain-containing protein [Planctomycetales bacterium]